MWGEHRPPKNIDIFERRRNCLVKRKNQRTNLKLSLEGKESGSKGT